MQFKHRVIAKALKIWAQVENRGPGIINKSLMNIYWSLKKQKLKK